MSHLIVFTHQRWNFVRRRTHHLMDRMARRFHVHVVEAPVRHDGPAQLLCQRESGRVEVLVPLLPFAPSASRPGQEPGAFDADTMPVVRRLLAEHFGARGIVTPAVAWTTTPDAWPLVVAMNARAVVYDSADPARTVGLDDGGDAGDAGDASDAVPGFSSSEAALLRAADLVFAGGPSMMERVRALHPEAVCLPSAVDADHFAPHRQASNGAEHEAAVALHRGFDGPRLGYYGVIDDRLDLGLVAALADAHPEWHVVMAGPVEGLDAARLPQRPNLHWLGRQPYARLPHLLAQWDLAFLPYAVDARTRCVHPTQALEYEAAERPVVSTPLPDMRALHADTVRFATDRASFVAACDELLHEPPAARERRATDMMCAASSMTWDRTAQVVVGLLGQVLAQRPLRPIALPRRPRADEPAHLSEAREFHPSVPVATVVAGPARTPASTGTDAASTPVAGARPTRASRLARVRALAAQVALH
jgi:hypothetical protein